VAIYDIYKEVKTDKYLSVFRTKDRCHAFNEDALLISRIMGWKLELLGKEEPYLKIAFGASYFKGAETKIIHEYKLGIKIFQIGRDETIIKPPFLSGPKNNIRKNEYISHQDVKDKILQIINEVEETTTANVQKLKSAEENTFLLHKKAKNLANWIFASASRYMPKNYRNSLGAGMVMEWTGLIREINKIRSIPPHKKENSIARMDILSQCSVHVDTLKDFAEAVFRIGGWKNFKQYRFVMLRLSEIGKIAQGVLSAAVNRPSAASTVA
jgi:hypothetical protein